MGLDMYLKATKYVSGYDFGNNETKAYTRLLKFAGLTKKDLASESVLSATLSVHVAYWRKANEIHTWFVKNCQDGVDDCRPSYVSREQLVELINTCEKVIKDPHSAKDFLPTTSGFFFGSTIYDDCYIESLKNTVDMLRKILDNPKFKDWGFQYQSSW